MGIGYWPKNVPRKPVLDAFFKAFSSQGYEPCGDGTLEPGFEKVALYGISSNGQVIPTHAARQLQNGKWTSKIGNCEDIQHDAVGDLDGPIYGATAAYMRRKL